MPSLGNLVFSRHTESANCFFQNVAIVVADWSGSENTTSGQIVKSASVYWFPLGDLGVDIYPQPYQMFARQEWE